MFQSPAKLHIRSSISFSMSSGSEQPNVASLKCSNYQYRKVYSSITLSFRYCRCFGFQLSSQGPGARLFECENNFCKHSIEISRCACEGENKRLGNSCRVFGSCRNFLTDTWINSTILLVRTNTDKGSVELQVIFKLHLKLSRGLKVLTWSSSNSSFWDSLSHRLAPP